MAITKKMEVSELESGFFSNKKYATGWSLERVKEELATGGKLELVQSQFSDPGPDYSKVTMNGETIIYSEGY